MCIGRSIDFLLPRLYLGGLTCSTLHISDNCTQENIAKASSVSLSSLQKLFRYVFDHSVNEHITKRKMTLAAEELLSGTASVAELAMKYGYSSTEPFSRAFRKVNC
ncbi:AraC family transcriptional regulator [Hungatella hathewayi]|nr:AraC family transcriptional regulator [Hungatella hathewayi]